MKNIFREEIKISERKSSGENSIQLEIKPLPFSRSEEAYRLTVNKVKGIVITGNSKAGVFYGIQSLRALIPLNAYAAKSQNILLPGFSVDDAPAFPFRGIMLDVARNFQPKTNLLKLIDIFSFYKINKLTLHLADDEGWRLQIEELPELTEIASKRGHTWSEEEKLIPSYGCGPSGDLAAANGFYSREDFKEILLYAASRHIEIIPEIDLPGHSRAAIKAMDVRYKKILAKGDTIEAEKYLLQDLQDQSEYRSVQLYNDNVICPCKEGVYNFLKTITQDIKEIYKEAGVRLTTLNIGGDEVPGGVWIKSPACMELIRNNDAISNVDDIKTYFFRRAIEIVKSENLITSGFEDIGIYRIHDEKGESKIQIREDFAKAGTRLVAWNNVTGWGNEDFAYRLANAGYSVVLGHVTNLYFDLAYTNSPDDPGQYWGGFNDTKKGFEYLPYNVYHSAYFDIDGNPVDPSVFKDKVKLTSKGKLNIAGLQGHLWSETLKNPALAEYFLLPKMLGMAERAWAGEPIWAGVTDREKRLKLLNEEWNVFANAIGQRELPRLDYFSGGVKYYLPSPGAVIDKGILKVNCEFPGLIIRYTTDGTDPDSSSPVYYAPVKVNSAVKLSTFSASGRGGKVIKVK